uniref:tRNA pseudouridine(55) synthase n=1 Tax=Strongyloides venezuelensis TaxID=75913 RepID=A0A0K0FGU2_STRVS
MSGDLAISVCEHCQKLPYKDDVNVVKIEHTYQCCCCFGLFDDKLLEKICFEVDSKIKDEGYDATSFIFALNLPVSFFLREYILQKLYLKEGFNVSLKQEAAEYFMNHIHYKFGLKPTLASDFTVTITLENTELDPKDSEFLLFNFPKEYITGKRKKGDSQQIITNAFTKMKVSQFGGRITEEMAKKYVMASPTHEVVYSILLEREPVFIAGRYCKFSRSLSQSPWSIGIGVPSIPKNSVSELVGDILKEFTQAESYKLLASGREDIDVRMLGTGRPFAIELKNCRKIREIPIYEKLVDKMKSNCKMLEDKINSSTVDIKVNSIIRVTQKEVESLLEGQEEKEKSYRAFCYSKTPISKEALRGLHGKAPIEVIQKTPVRVLKRRSLLDRPRTILTMSALPLDDNHFHLRMTTQAGTYVKEFVHGDFGRTRPCLSELLGLETGTIDILELDVEDVNLKWPPEK